MVKEMAGEIEVIRDAASGNTEAFGALLTNYKDALYNFVLRMTRDESDAEDVVQETFIKAFSNLSEFKINLKFSTWLYTIALNLTRNKMKRKSLVRFLSLNYLFKNEEDEVPMDIADNLPTPESAAIQNSEICQVNGIIGKLSGKYKEIFILRHIDEMSYEEISKITGLPLGTVETRIHRANKLVMDEYKRKFENK